MGQRVYLPKDVQLDIGSLELSLATTNIVLRPFQDIVPYRAHGEKYQRQKSGKLSRSLGLAGIYDGAEANAFKALQAIGEVSTRLLLDKGHDDVIHAGRLLVSDYEVDTSGDAIMVTGAAEFTGTVYIGSGDELLSADINGLGVEYDVGIVVVKTAGEQTSDSANMGAGNGQLRLRATRGATTYDATVETREQTGVFIAALPATGSSNTARPASGTWNVSLTPQNYSTDPVLRWGMVKAEGTF